MLAQAGFQRDVKALFAGASDQARAALIAAAGADGQIPAGRQRDVKMQVGRIVSDLFTPADNRSAYASDGVTPLAPYPRILNKWLAIATFFAVQQQEQWLRKHIPADVFAYLRRGRRSIGQVAETASEELLARAREMRLFAPSPFTRIDPERRWVPPHKWTDDKGYRLSDRIWRVDEETRRKIDEVLTQALRDGTDAIRLSRMVTAYLNPTETRRTDKPYNVNVNYAAMRLARTEISRAFNEAAFTAGVMNPYVNGYDLARSGNGDPSCPVCQQHATIDMGGNRVRQPYSMEGGARYAPLHPNCMCVTRVVTRDPKEVTAELRAAMQGSYVEMNVNPADAQTMTVDLLGTWALAIITAWLLNT